MSQLSGLISKSLGRLREKLPDRRVGLAPADVFFCRKVDLPENLSWEDKYAYIELALEGNAPFPMEQLAWGFLEHKETPFAFVYATPASRLRRIDIDPAENFFQLFPGFITLFGDTFDKPTIRFLCQNGVISALHLEARHPVPVKIISRRVAAELMTDDTLLEARRHLEDSLHTDGYTVEDGLWLGEGLEIQPDERIRFRHRHVCGGTPQGIRDTVLDLPEQSLWAADLRDSAYAARERVTRRRSRLIWKSLNAAVIAAIILLLFQLGTAGLSAYNAIQEQNLQELEPLAVRVENKLTLAERLTRSTEEDLKPFLLMEAINPLRPDAIFFDDVRSEAYNQLEIEGQSAEGVTPVNAFADSIKQLEFVQSVENNSRTRNNQTSFELIITFASLPPEPAGGFYIPDEEEESEEDSEEENA